MILTMHLKAKNDVNDVYLTFGQFIPISDGLIEKS